MPDLHCILRYSTLDFDHGLDVLHGVGMKFDQHGGYKIWRHNNVIYAELSGIWNKEAAINYAKEFKALASEYTDNWGHYVCFDHWELCSADVFDIVQSLVDWCVDNGLRRAAQVYSHSAIKEQVISKMVVEELGQFKRAVFDDKEQAANWLTEQGYKVTFFESSDN